MVRTSVWAALGAAAVVAAAPCAVGTASATSPSFQQKLRGMSGGLASFRQDVETLTQLGDGSYASCTKKIKEWRDKLHLPEITDHTSAGVDTKLQNLDVKVTCDDLKTGKMKRIRKSSGNTVFVFATPNAKAGSEVNGQCNPLVEGWLEGFDAFDNAVPPAYTEPQEMTVSKYDDPKAAAFFAMLLPDKSAKIYCGTDDTCSGQESTILCILTDITLEVGQSPVTPAVWAKVLEEKKVPRPSYEDKSQDFLDEMNNARALVGLDNDKAYTLLSEVRSISRSQKEAIDTEFSLITCDDLKNDKVHLHSNENYTFFMAVKDNGDQPPSPQDAMAYWKKTLESLENQRPGQYTGLGQSPYTSSAIVGFVSLYADDARKIKCQLATKCSSNNKNKAAVICAIETATLTNSGYPISTEVWEKVIAPPGPVASLKPLADDSFLSAINAYRTNPLLGLVAFNAVTKPAEGSTAAPAPKRAKIESVVAAGKLASAITCEQLEKSSVAVTGQDGTESLIYYVAADGAEATGAAALLAWQQAFSKSDKARPGSYDALKAPYNDAALTNFVSIVTDKMVDASEESGAGAKAAPKATCFSVEGCTKKAVVCELKPAVLSSSEPPVSEETWKKVTAASSLLPPSSSSSSSNLLLSVIAAATAIAALF